MNIESGLLNYITPRSLLQLLDAIRLHGPEVSKTVLRDDLRVRDAALCDRLDDALSFLSSVGVVQLRTDDVIEPCQQLRHSTAIDLFVPEFRDFILNHLRESNLRDSFATALQWQHSNKVWSIDSKLLPWGLRGLRRLLLSLGVFQRSSSNDRHWVLDSSCAQIFVDTAREMNVACFHRHGLTPEEILKRIEKNVEAGSSAENWVLQRERERLCGHPLAELITRISELNSGCGFDILSFSSLRSMVHDRFIEVKSHTGTEGFYWSVNEIEAAKRLGTNYILFIVNRDRMGEKDYSPKSIRNPHPYFFVNRPPDWSIASTEWKITRLARSPDSDGVSTLISRQPV